LEIEKSPQDAFKYAAKGNLVAATAVAKAAMDCGVAQNPLNIASNRQQLEKRLGEAHAERELAVAVGS
jgi:hypothetical protein